MPTPDQEEKNSEKVDTSEGVEDFSELFRKIAERFARLANEHRQKQQEEDAALRAKWGKGIKEIIEKYSQVEPAPTTAAEATDEPSPVKK